MSNVVAMKKMNETDKNVIKMPESVNESPKIDLGAADPARRLDYDNLMALKALDTEKLTVEQISTILTAVIDECFIRGLEIANEQKRADDFEKMYEDKDDQLNLVRMDARLIAYKLLNMRKRTEYQFFIKRSELLEARDTGIIKQDDPEANTIRYIILSKEE